MENNLPVEILSNIAVYLSQGKLCTCIRVSRSWYAAFIPTLYTNVEIKGERQLNQFVDALYTKGTLSPLGRFVRKLKLDQACFWHQSCALSHLCPFVVELDYPCLWYPQMLKFLQLWNYIADIRSLRFVDLQSISLDSLGSQITTSITSIILGPSGWSRSLSISLYELETVHGTLPHLRSLALQNVVIEGEMLQDITPCDTMQCLSLDHMCGGLWGHYFARKYTNLKKLCLKFPLNQIGEAGSAEAIALARSCKYLEHLECPANHIFNLHRQLMEILQEIRAPLTYIGLRYCSDLRNADHFGIRTISHFRETVSKIDIHFCRPVSEEFTVFGLLGAMRACLHLVDLTLGFNNDRLDVGFVLDSCEHLTSLVLLGRTRLCNNSRRRNQHGLRNLSMQGVIGESVFPYLSRRCPQLTYLACKWIIDYHQRYLLCFAGQNLETLKARCYSTGETIYKVTRIGKPEQSTYWSTKRYTPNDKPYAEYRTRPFRDKDGDGFPDRELADCSHRLPSIHEPEIIERAETNVQNMFKIPITEDNRYILTGRVIISIQYHGVDQLYLNGTRVY